jgi:hypothetical protein
MELGATEVFDYRKPEVGKKINVYANDSLKYAWDCIGTDESTNICSEALASGPGAHFGTILHIPSPRPEVRRTSTFTYNTGVGEDFVKGDKSSRVMKGMRCCRRSFRGK